MAPITTPFAGTETAAVTYARLQSIVDHYYGAGYYDTLTTRAAIRAALNDLQVSEFDFLADTELASSFIAKLNRVNDPANLGPELDALTAASTAAFWDFSDASTVFASADTSVPATPGSVISRFEARSVGTVASANFSQVTTQRPIWQTTYGDFDGVNDHMVLDAAGLALLQNAPAAVAAFRFRVDSLAENRTLLSFSRGDGQFTTRFEVLALTGGELRVSANRADTGTVTFRDSAAGTVTVGTDYTFLATVDFATGGVGAIKGYLNGGDDILNGGSSSGSASMAGTGNVANTASAYASLGRQSGGAAPFDGRIYRAFAGGFLPTEAQRAVISGVIGG